jgi:hypothetical protein
MKTAKIGNVGLQILTAVTIFWDVTQRSQNFTDVSGRSCCLYHHGRSVSQGINSRQAELLLLLTGCLLGLFFGVEDEDFVPPKRL